jgi:hypothetical protein
MLDIKLYFHIHVYFMYPEAQRTLGLIRYITYFYCRYFSYFV